MGITLVNIEGLTRIKRHLERLQEIDCTPLLIEGEQILREENEAGLRRGEDCHGQPMPPTQREQSVKLSQKKGGGPSLVPDYEGSRAIDPGTVKTRHTLAKPWICSLGWIGFDTAKGEPILAFHANPDAKAPYPKRDIISAPRPNAVKRFREAAKKFLIEQLRYKR